MKVMELFNLTNVKINYEGSQLDQVKSCLFALYTTKEGSQPLDRNFGINSDIVGYPLNTAKNLLALEIIEKTDLYEPRVGIRSVDFEYDESGMLIPTIYIIKGKGW